MRRAEAKRDFVADTTELVFENGALAIGNAGAFPLTDHAHGQIADRVGFPRNITTGSERKPRLYWRIM